MGDYLYAIDLYNYAYWWECHEVLEGLWRAGQTTEARKFFPGSHPIGRGQPETVSGLWTGGGQPDCSERSRDLNRSRTSTWVLRWRVS